jgi:hypothetical protein
MTAERMNQIVLGVLILIMLLLIATPSSEAAPVCYYRQRGVLRSNGDPRVCRSVKHRIHYWDCGGINCGDLDRDDPKRQFQPRRRAKTTNLPKVVLKRTGRFVWHLILGR